MEVRDELRQRLCGWEREEDGLKRFHVCFFKKDLEKVDLAGFVDYQYTEGKEKEPFVIRSRFLA